MENESWSLRRILAFSMLFLPLISSAVILLLFAGIDGNYLALLLVFVLIGVMFWVIQRYIRRHYLATIA